MSSSGRLHAGSSRASSSTPPPTRPPSLTIRPSPRSSQQQQQQPPPFPTNNGNHTTNPSPSFYNNNNNNINNHNSRNTNFRAPPPTFSHTIPKPLPQQHAPQFQHATNTITKNTTPNTKTINTPSTSLTTTTTTYDPSQLEAIESDIHRPLIISAGPGSGKTRTLCGRIVHLLQQGVKSHEILTLTFSKSAAREMEHRIDQMSIDLPSMYETQSIKVSTFHAFCLSVLHSFQANNNGNGNNKGSNSSRQQQQRSSSNRIQLGKTGNRNDGNSGNDGDDDESIMMKHFSIATRSQQLSFLKEAIVKHNFELTGGRELQPDDPLNQQLFKKEDAIWLLNWISKQKCRGITPLSNMSKSSDSGGGSGGSSSSSGHMVEQHRYFFFFEHYERQLRFNRLIDFTDMILMTNELFERANRNSTTGGDEWLDRIRNRYKYILVDEFQDLNPSQFKILMHLLKRHRNVTIVGDDDQSIYGFRGGTAKLFAQFRMAFPDHVEKLLQVNYRSTMNIVRASQSLIQYNRNRTRKKIVTNNETGERVRIKGVHSIEEEVEYIANSIKSLVTPASNSGGGSGGATSSSYRDIAIISRLHKNALSKYEDEMKKRGIPFVRYRKKGFSDREIIRIVLGYMSLSVNEYDDESFRKVVNTPSRGVGEAAQLYIENYRKELRRKSLLDALRHAEKSQFPKTNSGHKVNKKIQAALSDFLGLIAEFSESSQQVHIRELIQIVADGIGCSSFAQKSKAKEQKNREVRRKVQVRRGQQASADEDDDTEMEDIEIEYNVEENLNYLMSSASQYTSERYDDAAVRAMSTSERIDLLKAFIDVTRADEDEREVMEKQGNPDAITITTIHGAKGLEWKHCFIVRANQGMMPIMYRKENDTDQEHDGKEEHFEEERRLFYVALSRAKKTCCITYVLANEKDRPSMFIEQIGREYVTTEQKDGSSSTATSLSLQQQLLLTNRSNTMRHQPISSRILNAVGHATTLASVAATNHQHATRSNAPLPTPNTKPFAPPSSVSSGTPRSYSHSPHQVRLDDDGGKSISVQQQHRHQQQQPHLQPQLKQQQQQQQPKKTFTPVPIPSATTKPESSSVASPRQSVITRNHSNTRHHLVNAASTRSLSASSSSSSPTPTTDQLSQSTGPFAPPVGMLPHHQATRTSFSVNHVRQHHVRSYHHESPSAATVTPKQESGTPRKRTFTQVTATSSSSRVTTSLPQQSPRMATTSTPMEHQLQTQESSQGNHRCSSPQDEQDELSDGFLFEDLDDLFELSTQEHKRQKTYKYL